MGLTTAQKTRWIYYENYQKMLGNIMKKIGKKLNWFLIRVKSAKILGKLKLG